jgi:hypothetical protein
MKKTINNKAVIALLKASIRVRNGQWIEGAPSHIFPEFLTELEKDGWELKYIKDTIPIQDALSYKEII